MELPEDDTAASKLQHSNPSLSDEGITEFAERHSLPRERAIAILAEANGDEAAADKMALDFTARI